MCRVKSSRRCNSILGGPWRRVASRRLLSCRIVSYGIVWYPRVRCLCPWLAMCWAVGGGNLRFMRQSSVLSTDRCLRGRVWQDAGEGCCVGRSGVATYSSVGRGGRWRGPG